MLGLYVHIPFCNKICPYCDFYKLVASDNLKKKFVNALSQEMKIKNLDKYFFDSLYIGGGSPSCLKLDLLEELFSNLSHFIDLKNLKEFTIEVNPSDITEEMVILLSKYHITRVSIGIETFSPKLQKLINRFISYKELERKIHILHKYHIENINIDLMYALPSETFEDLDNDLKLITQLKPTHISAYSLILEERTIFYHLYVNNKLTLIDDKMESRMYHHVCNFLTKNGYFHYETSNFAKKGYESIHNLIYWNCEEYIAIGPSASSYLNSYRFKNIDNLNKYLEGINNNKLITSENDYITFEEKMKEEIILGLRKCNGISKSNFLKKYSIELFDAFPKIKNLIIEGLLKEKNDKFYIPQKYFYIGNYIILKIL